MLVVLVVDTSSASSLTGLAQDALLYRKSFLVKQLPDDYTSCGS